MGGSLKPPFAISQAQIQSTVRRLCNAEARRVTKAPRGDADEQARSGSYVGTSSDECGYRCSTRRSRSTIVGDRDLVRRQRLTADRAGGRRTRRPHHHPFGHVPRKSRNQSRCAHSGRRLRSRALTAADATLPVVTVPRGVTATISGVTISGGRVGLSILVASPSHSARSARTRQAASKSAIAALSRPTRSRSLGTRDPASPSSGPRRRCVEVLIARNVMRRSKAAPDADHPTVVRN